MKYILALALIGCGAEIEIQDSEHKISLEFCDKEAFPEPEERRRCIERILDILEQ